jgi:succinate dehydrogenase / fumarate reductase, membrane anchor subunit
MESGTGLGKVRGLGSARAGSHHWWSQRLSAFGNLMLGLWLLTSLARLPSTGFGMLHDWMRSPFVAVPLALLVINLFWHIRLGLQVVIEDYVKGPARIVTLGLLHLWVFGLGGLALFSILKIALSVPGTPAG